VGSNGTVTVNLGDMTSGSNQIVRIVASVDGNGILTYNENHPPGQQLTQISNTGNASSSTTDPNSSNNNSTGTTSLNYCSPPGLQFRPDRN
jgi:hypothetical protein